MFCFAVYSCRYNVQYHNNCYRLILFIVTVFTTLSNIRDTSGFIFIEHVLPIFILIMVPSYNIHRLGTSSYTFNGSKWFFYILSFLHQGNYKQKYCINLFIPRRLTCFVRILVVYVYKVVRCRFKFSCMYTRKLYKHLNTL